MADRYPDRPLPAADYGRGDQHGSAESDPLAELARLIGQTDPFGTPNRADAAPPRAAGPRQPPQSHYQAQDDEDDLSAPPGRPQWMQRANVQRKAAEETPHDAYDETSYDEPSDDYRNAVHPLHRYATPAPAALQQPAHQHGYNEPAYDDEQPDPARYDDALYGQLESGEQDYQREPSYPDDPYAYQAGYEEPQERPRRRGGMLTVAAVLALAVVGTGAAFAYRTYVGSPRSGEPPIIKADNTPTKVVPAPTDASGKTTDRMPTGDGSEKMVSREEAPVDVNARAAGPRVVFPPLNPNANPPPPASVSTGAMAPTANAAAGAPPSNGTMPNNEPRKVRTFSVHGEQPDGAAAPVTAAPAGVRPGAARPAPAAGPRAATPAANAPLSLSPDSAQASLPPTPAEPRTRMAATTPGPAASGSDGRFLVQLSSQATEAEAQSSFRALQKKFPDQLGSQSAVIKRAELGGDKGVRYRAMVGPFASRDEAKRFCTGYQGAGGQCYVP